MNKIVIGSVKLFISGIVFFTALEVCARIDDAIRYKAPLFQEYSADMLHVDDKDGYRRNVPNVRFEKWQNNRYGFRGPDFELAKAPGVLRVVCLGSSETYGFHESPGEEWPAQLQRQLPSNRFQVINAAVVGTSLPSFTPYIKNKILPLKPDILVLVVPPLFYFNFNKIPTIQITQKTTVEPGNTNEHPPVPLVTKIMENVRCVSKVKQVVKQAIKNDFPNQFRENQLQSLTRQVQNLERRKLSGKKPLDSIPEEYLIRFHDELSALVSMLQGHGISVVLTSYPSLLNVENNAAMPELTLGIRKFCIGLSAEGLLDGYAKFSKVSAAVALEQKTMFVDSFSHMPKTTKYFGDGVHYTDLGARRMSELVASSLLSNPFVLKTTHESGNGINVGGAL